jgi:hypothetical protein
MIHYYSLFSLYLLGAIFVLLLLEPTEEAGPWGLIKLAFLWPIATVWMIICEFILPDDEQ